MKLSDMSPALQARIKAKLSGGDTSTSLKGGSARQRGHRHGNRPSCKASASPNRTEAEYNTVFLSGKGLYECLTLRLPGGSRYTPDWLSVDPDGTLVLHEVKGSYRFPSEGRSRVAFNVARESFPMFRFVWAKKSKKGWVVEPNPTGQTRRDETP